MNAGAQPVGQRGFRVAHQPKPDIEHSERKRLMNSRQRPSTPNEAATCAGSDLTDFDRLMRSLLVERYGAALVTEKLPDGPSPPPATTVDAPDDIDPLTATLNPRPHRRTT
jgi:hypothetical protein